MLLHFALLFCFTTTCAGLTTWVFFSMTHNPWVSSFFLAGVGVLFTLENIALIKEIKQKDEEIELLRATHSQTLLKKIQCMEVELRFLRKEREEQRILITNLRLMGLNRKSCSL